MVPKNVLFVSIAFPPKSDPECLQTAKTYRYLAQDPNLTLDVVTSASPTLFMPDDASLATYDIGYRQKVSLKIWENKYINFILRKLRPGFLEQPDSKFRFHTQWKKAISQLKARPDVIYSRSFPLSSTILAYRLAEHYNVPWIMHLSDPWIENPLHQYPGKARQYHECYEQSCMERASQVTFTSANALELYRKKYPKWDGKFLLYPNVYDPADVKANPIAWGQKLKIVYTGGMALDRSARHVFPLLEKWETLRPEVAQQVEVVFAGPMDRANHELFSNNELPWVRHVGQLPYPEALELQRSAHLLLVIDNPLPPEQAVFFPSKLLDYFIAQRPILAVTSPDSPTQKVLQETGHVSYTHGDEQLVHYLDKMLTEYQQRAEEKFFFGTVPSAYDAETNAQRLAQWLKSI